MPVRPFAPGNYRFLTHAFQYSGGVAAEPGYAIERARFHRPGAAVRGSTRSKPISARHAVLTAFAPANCAARATEQGLSINRHSQRLRNGDLP
jgi:hypothetical protein